MKHAFVELDGDNHVVDLLESDNDLDEIMKANGGLRVLHKVAKKDVPSDHMNHKLIDGKFVKASEEHIAKVKKEHDRAMKEFKAAS